MKKSMFLLYGMLAAFSVAVVLLSLLIPSPTWNAIVMSIGSGGFASSIVAWLIDLLNQHNKKKEDEKKFEIILEQYVKLYRRLVWTTVNECYDLYHDNNKRNLYEWLSMLSDESRYKNVLRPQETMQRRCEYIYGTLVALQRFIENFQVQSATLILNNFPEIESILSFFELQHIYAWGSIKQYESGQYKDFCMTTHILYKKFIEKFPQYQNEFTDAYCKENLKDWMHF